MLAWDIHIFEFSLGLSYSSILVEKLSTWSVKASLSAHKTVKLQKLPGRKSLTDDTLKIQQTFSLKAVINQTNHSIFKI